MNATVLAIHNIVRWVILILGVYAVLRAFFGWQGKRSYTKADRQAGMFFGIILDIQLLVGLMLYFIFSPITKAALQNFGAAMADAGARFFALEHALYMLLAVVFAHIGSAQARRASGDAAKHRAGLLWYGLALLVILLGMPWMRPLLPSF